MQFKMFIRDRGDAVYFHGLLFFARKDFLDAEMYKEVQNIPRSVQADPGLDSRKI
jgi:hypothetical protein